MSSISGSEASVLAQRLWQLAMAGTDRRGAGLSTRLADALVGDFAVTLDPGELPVLRSVLFRLAATMSLTAGLAALAARIEGADPNRGSS